MKCPYCEWDRLFNELLWDIIHTADFFCNMAMGFYSYPIRAVQLGNARGRVDPESNVCFVMRHSETQGGSQNKPEHVCAISAPNILRHAGTVSHQASSCSRRLASSVRITPRLWCIKKSRLSLSTTSYCLANRSSRRYVAASVMSATL